MTPWVSVCCVIMKPQFWILGTHVKPDTVEWNSNLSALAARQEVKTREPQKFVGQLAPCAQQGTRNTVLNKMESDD